MIRRLPKAKIVTLFVTYGCNLNCIYCFEHYKDPSKKMPLELAQSIILKEIEEHGEKFKLVLRIKVQGDPDEYKNSIMTFWHIGETTWKKSLKNKKVLYKRE